MIVSELIGMESGYTRSMKVASNIFEKKKKY